MNDTRSVPTSAEAGRFYRLILKAAGDGTLRKLTFSLPAHAPLLPPRTTARLSELRGRAHLSCEQTLQKGKVQHLHIPSDDPEGLLLSFVLGYDRVFLSTSLGDAELMRSAKGKETLRGVGALEQARPQKDTETFLLPPDRQVRHIFDGTAPFLQKLGISDATGRVHDKKQSKFRQINRFLELFEDVYDQLPATGKLCVYDLCCGKSYLSFALYAYLCDKKGREVDMLCMDLKEDVMAACGRTATELGFDGMRFCAGDIRTLPRTQHPHLVVSLHACDIATDIVLDTAVELGADVILSTPCCHRYINRRLCAPRACLCDRPPASAGTPGRDADRCASPASSGGRRLSGGCGRADRPLRHPKEHFAPRRPSPGRLCRLRRGQSQTRRL